MLFRSLSKPVVTTWLLIFALSITAALVWAYQFYVPHNMGVAAFALGVAATLTMPLLLLTFRASLLMGVLLIPYQLWVIIATTLAWGYSVRN